MASQLYNYSPDDLQEILDISNSFKDVLRNLEMCDHGANYTTLRKIIKEYNLDLTQINKNRQLENEKFIRNLHNKHRMTLEEILVENSTYKHGNNLKKKLFEAGLKEYRCEKCGLTEWQGEPIPLQLHHKNGVHNDNRIENLELLCPNCHALTDTFSGKNIDYYKQKYKNKKLRKQSLNGISEDGQKLYDGYGNYKILCPICKTNFMNKEADKCRNCYDKERNRPNISKEELYGILLEHNYTSAALILNVERKTVSRWHKYYIDEDREKGIVNVYSDKAPSREQLKEDIRNMSFLQVGKKYNVTDNANRKWGDTYKLPRHAKEIKLIPDEKWELI